jgi:5-(carboxyamino)imidazole ribonucleotide mutase
MKPLVSIVMGSQSDLSVMKGAVEMMEQFNIPFELTIVSAHRTPERLVEYSKTLVNRDIKVVIAGAGGAAHLPGMIASITTIPVIGVPIKSTNSIDGWDSVLSILQMPTGVPVATMALNGAKNAGIFAAQIIGSFNEEVNKEILAYKNYLRDIVLDSVAEVKESYSNEFDK